MEGFRYLDGVATLELHADRCVGCGLCETVCPHGVLAVSDGKARITDRDACMECGACARNCPVEALSVSAGVGCAGAIIKSWLTGAPPTCGCEGGGGC
ncbi:mercury methylation ferredoxin HgcB [Deferrisoma camini]|uniref:mercury methylation ferredoxin HgcB n=1 Tax=Deferrisoma camini TaxID=1035120 RepID=UPI00046CA855|nr:mercury methylation ferredoxin HgcB [Deferrisoma camini]